MTQRLTPAAAAFISRMWRNGTIATLNKKGKTGAVNSSQWLTPERLTRVTLLSVNDLYFSTGTATQIPPTNAEGKTCDDRYKRIQNAYLASVNALYTEFDFKDFDDADTATEHVSKLPHQPSIIINSGGGLHCYWLLKATYCCSDELSRERLKTCISAFVTANGGDTAAKDLARVLRVPDTLNTKYTPPRPVSFVRCNYTLEYQFDMLEAWALSQCPPPPAPPKRERVPTPTATGEITEQMRRWANDKLDENRQKLRTEPSGQRNRVARDVAYHTGTIAHLIGLSLDAIFDLFASDIAHWGDVRNDENTIRRGLCDGAKNEFTPRKDEFTPYWAICASLMRQLTAGHWNGTIAINGKTTRRKIADKATGELMRIDSPLAIRLADVGAALAAIVELVLKKVKPIDAKFTISARQLARLMLLSNVDTASWRLQALCQLGYLTKIKPAATGNKPAAPTYAITTKYVVDSDRRLAKAEALNAFECMQTRDTKINTNTNMPVESAPDIAISVTTLHTSKNDVPISMFYARAIAARKFLTTKHDSINGVVRIGADGKSLDKHTPGVTQQTITSAAYGGLGSPNRIISEHLKKGDLFPSQIVELTGLSLDTVRRSLRVMVNDGVVNRGDGRKNKPYKWLGLESERLTCEFGIYDRLSKIDAKNAINRQKFASRFTTATPEPQRVTGITIASDDERAPTPAPAPAPITINIVAAWLAKLADEAATIVAGNPLWIPKRELSASEFDAVRTAATGYNINLIDANPTYYQARAE